ncbi:MAG: NhaC family Na+:H+ antiporter [Colwellia sp.]|jgi:NhaC family Na+:H+ antiporter
MSKQALDQINPKEPSMLDACIPVISLVALLATAVVYFGNDSSYGPNQIALLLAMGIAAVIGIKNGYQWHDIEKAIISGISLSLGAVLILLAVGSLIGTWLLSGTVPTMIYYGLQILDPSWFYAAACIICGIVALSIGSSWTTAATIGVALIGIAQGLSLDPAITAGAVISGAYFGDKMSPLSETTNLAPAIAGSELLVI